MTTAVAHTLTNTIGFFPNATENYADFIRDYSLSRNIGTTYRWLSPSNVVYSGMTWDIPSSLVATTNRYNKVLNSPASPARTVSVDTQWWTNYVTLSSQKVITASNEWAQVSITTTYVFKATSSAPVGYPDEWWAPTPVWIYTWLKAADTFVADTNHSFTIHRTGYDPFYDIDVQNYTNGGVQKIRGVARRDGTVWSANGSLPSACPVSLSLDPPPTQYYWPPIDITIAGTIYTTNYGYTGRVVLNTNFLPFNAWTTCSFAFERDATPHTWSTNSYNDMARALAVMQYQMNWQSQVVSFKKGSVRVVWVPSGESSEDRWVQGVWDWGPITYEEYGSRDYSSCGFYVSDGIVPYYGGVYADFTFATLSIVLYNTSPFVWENGITFGTYDPPLPGDPGGTYSNGHSALDSSVTQYMATAWNGTNLLCDSRSKRGAVISSGWMLEPGKAITNTLGFVFSSTNDLKDLVQDLGLIDWCDTVAIPYLEDLHDTYSGGFRMFNNGDIARQGLYDRFTNEPSVYSGLYSWSLGAGYFENFYKVRFTALTNYLDHAPAR